jgi:hypothetical protein
MWSQVGFTHNKRSDDGNFSSESGGDGRPGGTDKSSSLSLLEQFRARTFPDSILGTDLPSSADEAGDGAEMQMELDKSGVEDSGTSKILEAYSTRRVVGGAFYTFQGGAARAPGLEIEESESPSRLVQVVLAAGMIRVYRDASLPREGIGQEQLDVEGWGILEPLAMQIRWWQLGLLRPLEDLEET